MDTFAYFHAAPSGNPSGLYLAANRRAKKATDNTRPMTGSQQGTGPDWSQVGTSNYSHFNKEATNGN